MKKDSNFVRVAINVVRRPGGGDNELPAILRGWFGPDAGAPGTRHAVALEQRGGDWHLTPLGQRRGDLQLWRPYSREETPPLFGLTFSTAIWNAGFVKRPGHIFLLATLDKSGHGSQFQYKDHFVSATELEWQSQNRTSQESKDGQDIQKHAERGIAVHLFVRDQKKKDGDVDFQKWEGDQLITHGARAPGAEVVIEQGTRPVAVLHAAEPVRRTISECIALAKVHEQETGKAPVLDADFAEDVEGILNSTISFHPRSRAAP